LSATIAKFCIISTNISYFRAVSVSTGFISNPFRTNLANLAHATYSTYFFFIFRRSKLLLDHWPKPFKVRVNIFSALQIQGKGQIIRVLSQTLHGASMRRCLSILNLSQCQIKWSTVSSSPAHTHTSDLQQFEIYQDAISR
jgi:hypothetical protein